MVLILLGEETQVHYQTMIENRGRHRCLGGVLLVTTATLLHSQYTIVGVLGGQSHRSITCSLEETEPEWIICHSGGADLETCESTTGPAIKAEQEGYPVSSLFGKEESSSTSLVDDGEAASSMSSSSLSTSAEYFRLCSDCTGGSEPYHTMDYYCPMVTDYCQVDHRRSSAIIHPNISIPKCFRRPSRIQEFSETILPLLVATFIAIVMFFICSQMGQRFICLMITMCLPCLQRTYAEYLLRCRPQLATSMIRRWIRRRGERFTQRYNELMNPNYQYHEHGGVVNNGGGGGGQSHYRRTVFLTPMEETLVRDSIAHHRHGKPHMLRLTTRIFRRKERANIKETKQDEMSKKQKDVGNNHNEHIIKREEDDDDDDDEDFDGCIICFGPICDGDRVGALQCQHLFHVPCLKTWLKQRNVCPLCLCEQVAEEVS